MEKLEPEEGLKAKGEKKNSAKEKAGKTWSREVHSDLNSTSCGNASDCFISTESPDEASRLFQRNLQHLQIGQVRLYTQRRGVSDGVR